MMLMAPAWTPSYAALIFLMWAIMMMAMMLPPPRPPFCWRRADAPTRRRPVRTTGLFVLGYLLVWFGFSLLATVLQWSLDRAGLLAADMASGSHAGRRIADRCRPLPMDAAEAGLPCPLPSPFEHLTRQWGRGPFRPARYHGVFCLGCCWMLMALLFVGGLMNVLWIAALALLVFIEKVLPIGGLMSHFTGVALIAWGVGCSCRSGSCDSDLQQTSGALCWGA